MGFKCINSSRIFVCCFCLFVSLAWAGAAYSDAAPKKLRIATVVIVQQDGLLAHLLEPFLEKHQLTIEYQSGHHRDVVQAVKAGQADLVMVHTKIKAMDQLTDKGQLRPGHAVMANPKAFLGPANDPAGIKGLSDPVEVMQHIQDAGPCFVINPHGLLADQQRQYLNQVSKLGCVIKEAKSTEQALEIAEDRDAYTLWGLHPYVAKTAGKLESIVIPHPELLQNIGVWVVSGTDVEPEAAALADYLQSPEVLKRATGFRLKNHPDVQAWWPPTP